MAYIQLVRGSTYLVAISDWYSRQALNCRIRNSMERDFVSIV